MKRKLTARAVLEIEEQPLCFLRKQLRSQLYRRRRLHISPVVAFSGDGSHFPTASDVSCESSIASVCDPNPPEIGAKFERIVTRSYYRKNFKNASRNHDEAVELSDVSCVESCSGTNRGGLDLRSSNVEEIEVEGADVIKSEVSSAQRISKDVKVKEIQSSVGTTQSEVVLEISGVNETSCDDIRDFEAENDDSAKTGVELNSAVRATKFSANEAAIEEIRPPHLVAFDFDLACSEQFSNGGITIGGEEVDNDEEEHNSSSSGVFHVISDSEFESSDYTPSMWSYDSGSQFSERSFEDESSSPTFELFQQFKQQFCRSIFPLKDCDDRNSVEINGLGLENEEDEESFRMMRRRERRQQYVHDYTEEYCNNTAYGDEIIQQRRQMVHWIVEQAKKAELQQETMFLGVNLLDRFLSKGYFKSVKNLQIAGIACLTLATRIEENQPYNCVRKKSFYVGGNIYACCEVVAMEWVVQEVLNFKCYLPTLYNFLWFYLKAARANENMEKTTKYLAVLTLIGNQQLCYWPSTVAAALVIIASIATNQDPSCHLITEIHARHEDKDLPECIKSMEWLAKYL